MPKKAKKSSPAPPPETPPAASETEAAASKPKKLRQKRREELVKNYTPKKPPPVTEAPSENRLLQFDYVREVMRKNVWYYRDRMSIPRGPCTLPVLRECWVNGVIDENTLVWGHGLADWLPTKNIRTLIPQIRTPEVRFCTFLKKHLALKPEIARMRKAHPERRKISCDQVDNIFARCAFISEPDDKHATMVQLKHTK